MPRVEKPRRVEYKTSHATLTLDDYFFYSYSPGNCPRVLGTEVWLRHPQVCPSGTHSSVGETDSCIDRDDSEQAGLGGGSSEKSTWSSLGSQGGLPGVGGIRVEIQSEDEEELEKCSRRRKSMYSGLEARELGHFRKLRDVAFWEERKEERT